MLRKIYPYVFRDRRLYPFLRTFYARGLEQPDDPFFSHMIRWENGKRLTSFFSPEFAARACAKDQFDTVAASLPPEFDSMDTVSRAQFLEASIFMSGYLLSCQADRVAMAHGVEIRVPFLDHRLLEFLGTLPSPWKLNVLQEKHLLKNAFRDILPREIVSRPKHPYRAPIQKSLLQGHARDVTLDALSPVSLSNTGYFDEAKVASLLAKMQQNKEATEVDEMALVGILTTQLLHRRFNMLNCGRSARLRFQRVIDRRGSPVGQAFQPA